MPRIGHNYDLKSVALSSESYRRCSETFMFAFSIVVQKRFMH
jgi:hypothetical protein